MSMLLDSPSDISKRGSRLSVFQRPSVRFGTKIQILRLDSPTTIEACKQLGILIKDIESKSVEDFRDPNLDEEIVHLRFEHYYKRYNEYIKEVYAKKREIVKQKMQTEPQQNNVLESSSILKAGSATSRLKTADELSPYLLKNSFSASKLLPSVVKENYNKTMSYLKDSHRTAEIKDVEDIIENSTLEADKNAEEFDSVLGSEISKYNKLKLLKQKEAYGNYETEIKRIKMAQELEERERSLRQKEAQRKNSKKKLEEDKKARFEEKLEQIKESNLLYEGKKNQEKENLIKKLEINREKFLQEAEKKRRIIAENEQKNLHKKRFVEERRERLKREEEARSLRLLTEIESKLYESQEKHNMTINEKTNRAHSRVLKTEEGTYRSKIQRKEEEEEHIQKMLEKFAKRGESVHAFQKKQMDELKKKELEVKEKNERLAENQKEIKDHFQGKIVEINEKFKIVQENLEAKKREDERNLQVKQEAKRLKQLDIQENFNKRERQQLYQRQIILEKQKSDKERIALLKQQKEILQRAKLEVTLQSKIENERIGTAILKMSKLAKGVKSIENFNEKQKKVLKEVLKPDDFKKIEEEEASRRKAVLAALKEREFGNEKLQERY